MNLRRLATGRKTRPEVASGSAARLVDIPCVGLGPAEGWQPVPKKFPPEFKRDVVTVARRGDLTVAEGSRRLRHLSGVGAPLDGRPGGSTASLSSHPSGASGAFGTSHTPAIRYS
jgi:hypothetical protein